jgi:hypothetical protein
MTPEQILMRGVSVECNPKRRCRFALPAHSKGHSCDTDRSVTIPTLYNVDYDLIIAVQGGVRLSPPCLVVLTGTVIANSILLFNLPLGVSAS